MFARLRTNFSGSASASYSCLNSDNLANWSGDGKYWKKWDGISVGNDGENINSIKYEPRSRLDLLSDSSIMQGNGKVEYDTNKWISYTYSQISWTEYTGKKVA